MLPRYCHGRYPISANPLVGLALIAPLLHDDDIADVGEALDPDSSVAMILFEHTWANALRNALVEAGAELIDSLRIAPEAIDLAQGELARTE